MTKPDFEKGSLVSRVAVDLLSRLPLQQRNWIAELPIPSSAKESIFNAINNRRVERAVNKWLDNPDNRAIFRPNSFSEHVH